MGSVVPFELLNSFSPIHLHTHSPIQCTAIPSELLNSFHPYTPTPTHLYISQGPSGQLSRDKYLWHSAVVKPRDSWDRATSISSSSDMI
jgi:hypothetical protein